jgi:hypothetical protein
VTSVSAKSYGDFAEKAFERIPAEIRNEIDRDSPFEVELTPRQQEAFAAAIRSFTLESLEGVITPEQRELLNAASTDEEFEELARQFGHYPQKAEIRVQEVFAGDVGHVASVHTGTGEGDCGAGFEEGETYLIWASKAPGGDWTTPSCSETKHSKYATEDIHALRAWKNGTRTSQRIYGFATDYTKRGPSAGEGLEEDSPPPAKGIILQLRGGAEPLETSTDQDGRFVFGDLEDGRYYVVANEPGWRITPNDSLVILAGKRCAELHLSVKQDQGTIRGRVTPQPGESLPENLPIEAVPVDLAKPAPRGGETQADGRFEMSEIEPGDYRVAISALNPPIGEGGLAGDHAPIRPYPETYYPGVSDPKDAPVFHVERGTTIDLGDWLLQKRLAERQLSGIVVRPDGAPALNAAVTTRRPGRSEAIQTVGPTAADGRFEVHVLETLSLEIRAAYYDTETGFYYVGSAHVGPETPSPVLVVLEPSAEDPEILFRDFFEVLSWRR